MEGRPEKMTFTLTEISTLQKAGRAVWAEIGPDAIYALAEADGVSPERMTLTRAEVLELVLDASRLESYMRRMSIEIPAAWPTADYDEMLEIMTPAFPEGLYGM
jgi:hypothetical protein